MWGFLTVIAKMAFAAGVLINLFFVSVFVAISVRYGCLIGLLALTFVCPCFKQGAGWMSRYTRLLRDNGSRGERVGKKILFQIIFSFFGIYGLYSVMAYLLSQTIGSAIAKGKVLPDHPYYVEKLL